MARAYPFLIAIVPILYFAANNPDKYGMMDLIFLLAVTAGACGVVYALASLVARGRAAPGLPAFVALLYVAWFFGYRRAVGVLTGDPARAPHLLLVAVGLVLSVALIWWVRRREGLLAGLGRFLTVMAALMVGWSAVQMGRGWLRGEDMIAKSTLARDLARPIEGPVPAPDPRPDVYLIVLDEYANGDVLLERFGYDNRPFEDSLRALGFHVPRTVRSNYLHTLLSIPSLLNAAHLTALEQDVGKRADHPRLPNHLLEHSRVVRYLQERGYEYVFFSSDWWHATSGSPQANVVFHAFRGFDIMRAMGGGELQRLVRGITLLSYFGRSHRWEAEQVHRTLAGLAGLAGAGAHPRFAFAHILKPHDPYVFGPDCEVLSKRKQDDNVGPYLEQLKCLNGLLLDTVGRILAKSRVPPVIILQGDHGTKLLHATGYKDPGEVPPPAARERFGAFGAYYLPDGGAEVFGDTVTIVNVMGNVLRHYFGADLPRAGDELYISPADHPYDFRKVDAEWLARGGTLGRKAGAGR